ncbi:MAG: LeuD/DmdB family oxidoreductase small subunit [Pollutimonas bauzanensis]
MTWHKVWRVGSNIDTDALAPGAYMKQELKDIARHCLENRHPGLAQSISQGDVLVAGPNFGIGSSREQAVGVLVELGVKAVVAPSFSGLYFRNAFNLGLLAVVCPDAERIPEGSYVAIDPANALIRNAAAGGQAMAAGGPPPQVQALPCQKIPGFLIDMAAAGGLLNQLEQLYLARPA